ncbi:AAA family ATPase [Pectobacterium carotovorum]|uniref:AAA family ATPase n=1 Tax=Pectobacterium carotovorum TaxID=554 RepID=UPI002B24CD4B|nr:AAA family ATPase [Pectobacterium carotovorum]
MGNIKVILGENGTGKTRYLLKYYQSHKRGKSIAMISNSLINPFPAYRDNSKHHYFDLRARDSFRPGFFSHAIRGYFSRLLFSHPAKDLFRILNHIGFDDELIIKRKSLYKVNDYKNNLKDERNYSLTPISNLKDDYYPYRPIIEKGKISPAYAEILSPILESTYEFKLKYYNCEIQHQAYLDHLDLERKIKANISLLHFNSLFKTEFFLSKNNIIFPLEYASSGELNILALGLFIKNFLDSDNHVDLPKTILIDEPENSLHPKWQREYIGFLHGFIGYKENVEVIIATHSPLIAMENHNYSQRIDLMEVIGGNLQPIHHDGQHNNIEKVYYELFDLLTPKNRYLSDYCNNLLKEFAEKKVSYDAAYIALQGMSRASFDTQQQNFLDGVIMLLKKIDGGVHD